MLKKLILTAGGLVPCDGPDCKVEHIFIMLKNIINFAMLYGGLICALVIAIGGIMMLLARGNEQKVTQARAWVTNAAIGLLIIFLAWAIINTIMTVVFDYQFGDWWKLNF